MNYFYTSTGERVSQATIDKRRSQAYRERYEGNPHPSCEGCGVPATCSAHIIPQSRLKTLHLSEMIYSSSMFFPSCFKCNSKIENPKGDEWKELFNVEQCLIVIKKYDPELYYKFMNNDRQ